MTRERQIYKVTLIGGLVNVLLLVFKFVAGIVGHSAAMVADAVHSLSDFATDVVVLVFVKLSSKPQDTDHEYGHGKYETLASTLIGLALLAVAIGIIWSGGTKVAYWLGGGQLAVPGKLALWAALASILLKEATFRYTRYEAGRLNSPAMEANAWHHRSDALSSIGTLVGIGGAIFLGDKWTVLDPLASIVVGAFIVKVSVGLLKDGIGELTEASLPESTEREILDIVSSFPDVSDPHKLKTRKVGKMYAIDLHIRMDGSITLNEAHQRTSEIERALRKRFGEDAHISIHTEPVK